MSRYRIGMTGIVLAMVLVAASVTAAGAVARPSTVDRTAADATAPTPTPTPNGTATFEQWVYDVTTGNTTAITVELSDTDTARLVFGGGTVEYAANVTVTDGNGDGQVTLLFDTAAAAGTGPTFAVRAEGDGLTVKTEHKVEGNLGGSNVPLAAYVDGTKTDGVTLLIRDPIERGTPTPSPTPTPTATASPTATPTPGDTTTTTSPGFGIAGGLVALAAAALLVRR